MVKEHIRVLRAVVFLIIALGFFLTVMQPFSPTGAVIDLTGGFSKLSFVLGFFLVVSGIVALFFLKIFQTNSKTKDI